MAMNPYQSYRKTEVSTADKGKLVLMVYDHCLKWLRKAEEEMQGGDVEKINKAVFKVQDGLTELQCALDWEQGGEITRNLHRLYDFYSRHLSIGMKERSAAHMKDVAKMMSELRESWAQAIENVRRQGSAAWTAKPKNELRLVG